MGRHHGRRDAKNDAWRVLFLFFFFLLLLVQNLSRGVERTSRKMPLSKRRQENHFVGFPERKATTRKRKMGKTFDDVYDDESERRGRTRRGETRYGRV